MAKERARSQSPQDLKDLAGPPKTMRELSSRMSLIIERGLAVGKTSNLVKSSGGGSRLGSGSGSWLCGSWRGISESFQEIEGLIGPRILEEIVEVVMEKRQRLTNDALSPEAIALLNPLGQSGLALRIVMTDNQNLFSGQILLSGTERG